MEIVFIGVNSAYPTKHSDTVTILLNRKYLIDCGTAAERELRRLGYNPMKLKEIYISHLDADHWLGLPNLLSTYHFLKKKIKIYGPKGIKKLVNNICKLLNIDNNFEVDNLKEKNLGDFKIKPFKNLHHGESYGFEIHTKKGKKIIISGDTRPLIFENYQNVDILIHEATFLEKHKDLAIKTNHSTVKEAIELGYRINAKKIILYHFSPRYSFEEIKNEASNKRVIVAKSNSKFVFD